MFDRLKKAFSQPSASPAESVAVSAVSKWASKRGLVYHAGSDGANLPDAFTLSGKIGNKVWKLEQGRASRDYIHGRELRARADLKLNDDVSVLIINRPLKDALEKRAYEMYTDTLQTTIDASLPEEMRWLAMYPEAGWDALSLEFWRRYAVLAEKREHALAWIDADLAKLLMDWPEPGPNEQIPFILMIMRGKAYLRMQYTPANMPTLEHSAKIFIHACQAGSARLATDILV